MLKKVWNLLAGTVGVGVKSFEEKYPEVSIERLERDIDKKLTQAYEKIIQAKVNVKLAERQFNKVKERKEKLNKNIETAIQQKNENMLVQLYLQEKEINKVYEMTEGFNNEVKNGYEKAEKEYEVFTSELNIQKVKLTSYRSMSEINKLRKELIVTTGHMASSDIKKDISRIEDIIHKQQFDIDARVEFKDNSIEFTEAAMDLEEAKRRAKEVLGS